MAGVSGDNLWREAVVPVINVNLLEGQTADKKRGIVRALTDAYCSITEMPPESVTVILSEVETRHWAKAGVLVSDR